jgi:hypothetical protein
MNSKKNYMILKTFSFALLINMGSCASAPETLGPKVERHIAQDPVVTELTLKESVDDTAVLEALTNAKKAKEEAIKIKAPNAATDEYKTGEQFYTQGLEEKKSGNWTIATESFNSATKAYKKSITTTTQKRERALAALADAESAIIRTELNANRALTEGLEEIDE